MTIRRRSALSPEEARKQYIRAAETVLLEQIQVDARRLDRQDDERRVAVGPFAKLNAEQVAAAAEGKSRGAITNLFKSQRQFQLQAMALVLEDPEVDVLVLPDPQGFDDPVIWIEALALAESDRGPLHGMDPAVGYGLNWALWLSQVPYGVWSEHIAEPSMHEFRHSVERLESGSIRPALAHFALEVRSPWTTTDLAAAMNSMVEGLWLNQCLSRQHPTRPDAPVAQATRDALVMLWLGATQPAGTPID
jgi:AcrR family transcriptional regulator